MAEIKDKVVTVESLSALHEYNKETYLTEVDPVIQSLEDDISKAKPVIESLSKKVEIQRITLNSENLNNYVEQGIYYFVDGSTPINVPENNNNGYLIVLPTVNYIKQLWLRAGTIDETSSETYVRTAQKGDDEFYWSAWERFITNLDVIPIDMGGTGATTAAKACANLGAATVLLGESIPSGANLSNYTTSGTYRSQSAEISATLIDTPWTGSGFKLEVLNTTTANQIMQELKCNSASARVFRRIATRDSSTGEWFFSPWYEVLQVALDEPYVSISRGGTGANSKLSAAANLGVLTAANIAGSDYDIPSGADLDTYRTAGVYRSGSETITNSLTNAPPVKTAGFRLEVKHTTTAQGIMQTAIYNSSTPTIYVRMSGASNGVFGSWHKLNFTSE